MHIENTTNIANQAYSVVLNGRNEMHLLDSGSSPGNWVGVQVPSTAL